MRDSSPSAAAAVAAAAAGGILGLMPAGTACSRASDGSAVGSAQGAEGQLSGPPQRDSNGLFVSDLVSSNLRISSAHTAPAAGQSSTSSSAAAAAAAASMPPWSAAAMSGSLSGHGYEDSTHGSSSGSGGGTTIGGSGMSNGGQQQQQQQQQQQHCQVVAGVVSRPQTAVSKAGTEAGAGLVRPATAAAAAASGGSRPGTGSLVGKAGLGGKPRTPVFI